jgi:NitT/TauT family transport system substrate-binding protein
MTRRRRLLEIGAAACSMLVAGRRAAWAQSALHLGISPFEAHADAYYAQDNGLFKKAGLDVDIQQFNGGATVIAAIVGGSLQIGAGSPLPLASARQRGVRVVLVAPGYIYESNASTPIDALAVAANSPYRTGRDLNGKTIAVAGVRSVAQLAAFSWIDRNGGDSSTVKAVELPQNAMADAVADGRVDAAEIGDPALSAGIDNGKVRIIGKAYEAIAKRLFASTWFATEDWADRNADVIRRFTGAINDASAWAVKNPEAAAQVLQKYMKVTFTRAHEYHARTLDPALIQPLLDAAARYKILERPMDAHEIIWSGAKGA